MFGLMFSSYVILISPIKFFSIMINHPKEIVSKIKDNLYLAGLYTKTGGEIYPAPVFLYLNRHSFHTVLQFK